MLSIWPLVLWDKKQRLRRFLAWAVLMLASISTLLHESVALYITADLIAAGLLLLRSNCFWQRALGLTMWVSVLMGLGFFIAEGQALYYSLSSVPDPSRLFAVLFALAWVQFTILVFWSAHDVFAGYTLRGFRAFDLSVAHTESHRE